MFEPAGEVLDWAPPCPPEGNANLATLSFLIGFRSAERHDHALPNMFDVVSVKAHQFRSAKCPCEANEQKRFVAKINRAIPHPFKDCEQIIAQDWFGLPLCRAKCPSDAPHCCPDQFVLRRVIGPDGGMGFSKCRHPPLDRSRCTGTAALSQILGDHFRGGRKATSSALVVGQIVSIGPFGRIGEGMIDQVPDGFWRVPKFVVSETQIFGRTKIASISSAINCTAPTM